MSEFDSGVAALPPELAAQRPADPTRVWGLNLDLSNAEVLTLDNLPHVDGVDKPSAKALLTMPLGLVADPRAKVPFRGGWTCGCVAESLPAVEEEMKKRGIIRSNIDIYQLGWNSGGVAASAGTHDRGMMVDVGQFSEAALEVWWEFGWNMQHRTPAQGFAHHGHGGPHGCTHGAPLAAWQMQVYVAAGRNGLRSNGAAAGPWKTLPKYYDALAKYRAAKEAALKKEDIIMALTETNKNDFKALLLDALADPKVKAALSIAALSATYGIDTDDKDTKANTTGEVLAFGHRVNVETQKRVSKISEKVDKMADDLAAVLKAVKK